MTALEAKAIDTDRVHLQWRRPQYGEADDYIVTVKGKVGRRVYRDIRTDSTAIYIDDLFPGDQYIYSVTSVINKHKKESKATIVTAVQCE